MLLLGIDIGTYSSKGVLVEPNGNIIRSKVINHNMSVPFPGWAEQDADKIWWSDFVFLCRNLLDGHPFTGQDVAAATVSAIGPCLLPLDKNGRPLRPGILYGVDTRADKEINYLNKEIGENNILKHSGMSLSSQAVGPKILWLKHNEPDIWKKTDHITTASSYIIYKLTGEKVIDRHTASHFIPLIDIDTLSWSDRFSNDIIELEKLPRLGWSDEIAGYVNSFGAEETGLKVGTPIAVGAVDALSEAISCGAINPGDLMLMYGSTAFMIFTQVEKTPDKRLWTLAGAFKGQYNIAAGMATAGSITQWFVGELARELPKYLSFDSLFNQASSIDPGSNGLIILPYFSGERTPINDPKARGVIAGLTLAHNRAHLFRAILEGVGYGIQQNINTFKKIGCEIKRIVAVGGGAKSEVWPQIVSDITGDPQEVPELTIGASYGDAFLAGLAIGQLTVTDIHLWVRPGRLIMPNLINHEVYTSLYQYFLDLYQDTKDLIHKL